MRNAIYNKVRNYGSYKPERLFFLMSFIYHKYVLTLKLSLN
jgi:hypothetical protein